jgi:hypothetical protein
VVAVVEVLMVIKYQSVVQQMELLVEMEAQVEAVDLEVVQVVDQAIHHQLVLLKERMEVVQHQVLPQQLLMLEAEEEEQLPLVQMVLITMEVMVVQD